MTIRIAMPRSPSSAATWRPDRRPVDPVAPGMPIYRRKMTCQLVRNRRMFHVESSDVRGMTADRIQVWTHRLVNHVPAGELGRYLLVGLWNTLFGYSTFAALVFILDPILAHGYILANVLSGLVNITVAF